MTPTILAHAFSTDFRAALDAARRAGARGVVLDPAVFPELVADSQTGRREIVNLMSRAEQPAVAVDVRLSTAGLAPGRGVDVEREIDRVGRAMDLARGLHAPLVCCDLGALPPAPDEPVAKPAITPALLGGLILPEMPKAAPRAAQPRDLPFESNVDQALRELASRADRMSVLVAFRASLGSLASLAAVLTRVDCPWFGVDLDPLAVLADEWSLDECFSRFGTQVQHVRGRDGLKGTGGRVQATDLGAGQAEWDGVIANLRDADYRGAISVDPIDLPNRAASASRGLAFLRERLTK